MQNNYTENSHSNSSSNNMASMCIYRAGKQTNYSIIISLIFTIKTTTTLYLLNVNMTPLK